MKSSPKTDQVAPGQCKGAPRPSGVPLNGSSARQLLLNQIKSKDNPVDKEMIRNPFATQFFKPNLFNLFNLIGFMICFSFYSQINQLELRIQYLELACQTGHSDSDSFQRKVGLNPPSSSPEPIDEKESILPVSIVEFVDRVS